MWCVCASPISMEAERICIAFLVMKNRGSWVQPFSTTKLVKKAASFVRGQGFHFLIYWVGITLLLIFCFCGVRTNEPLGGVCAALIVMEKGRRQSGAFLKDICCSNGKRVKPTLLAFQFHPRGDPEVRPSEVGLAISRKRWLF